ncbi:MAG: hypothetical protein K5696_13010 [Lachnospiraceae bacterium]|nr:hypothetical protein [Lachnospiraceae bacterium]
MEADNNIEKWEKMATEGTAPKETGVFLENNTATRLAAARKALKPHIELMDEMQRKRVDNAMQTMRLFKPAYYDDDAYEFQCVIPLTETLLSIGEELGVKKQSESRGE